MSVPSGPFQEEGGTSGSQYGACVAPPAGPSPLWNAVSSDRSLAPLTFLFLILLGFDYFLAKQTSDCKLVTPTS